MPLGLILAKVLVNVAFPDAIKAVFIHKKWMVAIQQEQGNVLGGLPIGWKLGDRRGENEERLVEKLSPCDDGLR